MALSPPALWSAFPHLLLRSSLPSRESLPFLQITPRSQDLSRPQPLTWVQQILRRLPTTSRPPSSLTRAPSPPPTRGQARPSPRNREPPSSAGLVPLIVVNIFKTSNPSSCSYSYMQFERPAHGLPARGENCALAPSKTPH